jgi:hypothetical protein
MTMATLAATTVAKASEDEVAEQGRTYAALG